jgi:hypothetical protein
LTEQQKAWLSAHPGYSPMEFDGDMTKGWVRQGFLLPTGDFIEISSPAANLVGAVLVGEELRLGKDEKVTA